MLEGQLRIVKAKLAHAAMTEDLDLAELTQFEVRTGSTSAARRSRSSRAAVRGNSTRSRTGSRRARARRSPADAHSSIPRNTSTAGTARWSRTSPGSSRTSRTTTAFRGTRSSARGSRVRPCTRWSSSTAGMTSTSRPAGLAARSLRCLDALQEETGFEAWASEQYLYHPRMAYAGTLDLAGNMPKLDRSKPASST
jgi:hypothetical protein